MKWKLFQLLLSVAVLFASQAKAEYYTYNNYSPYYDGYSGLYNTGGTNLYNLGAFGSQLGSYYGNAGYGNDYSYYPTNYGSCGGYGSVYSSGCSAYNNLGFYGYSDPSSYYYGNSFGYGYDSSYYYPSSSSYWSSNYGYDYGYNSSYNIGWDTSYYYPSYYDYGYGYGGGYNYWNYSPVNIYAPTYNIYYAPQTTVGSNTCNGVTVPCTTPTNPVDPVNPVNPIFTPQTQVSQTPPNRIRVPRGAVGRATH
ncbi:MAG: hypothetical protein R3B54_03150 [Bdellovibrionota bacterium]